MAITNLPMKLIGPLAVGAVSAAASVAQRNAIAKGSDNQFLKQAGLMGDVLIAAYTLANVQGALPRGAGFPTDSDHALMTAGAGVGLLTKRVAEYVGGEILELPGWPRANGALNPSNGGGASRMLRGGFRRPSSAVETGVQPRKRQFFSVV
tara:strand:- start:34 stop:486 length:453 start_codon:yes stop_codon:yes gene_type:complete